MHGYMLKDCQMYNLFTIHISTPLVDKTPHILKRTFIIVFLLILKSHNSVVIREKLILKNSIKHLKLAYFYM